MDRILRADGGRAARRRRRIGRAQRGTWTVVVALGSDFDVRVIGTLVAEATA